MPDAQKFGPGKLYELTDGDFDLESGNFEYDFSPGDLAGFTKMQLQMELDSMVVGNDDTALVALHSLSAAGLASTSPAVANIVDTPGDLVYELAVDGTGDNIVLIGTVTQPNGFGHVKIRLTPDTPLTGDVARVFALLTP